MHGGKAPQTLRKAAQRSAEHAAEQKARAALAKLDVQPVTDPLTELQTLAGQVVAWKNAIAERVNTLTAIRFEDRRGAEQLRSEVALFERAMDRCTSVLTAMAKLDLDERLVALDERRAELVFAALSAGLAEMGLDPAQQREARTHVARNLRLVAGGQA